MEQLTKQDKKQLTALIKKGNLARCDEWLGEIRALIDRPYNDKENAFDRCMEITKSARDFYKEAMSREDYYRGSWLTMGAANLLHEGYIDKNDVSALNNEELRNRLLSIAE